VKVEQELVEVLLQVLEELQLEQLDVEQDDHSQKIFSPV
jgi:hypothetical protein